MGKKPTKKNTKPMIVEIDDKPLLDTSNLDTSIAPSSNKKDNKKNNTTSTTTTTTTPSSTTNETKEQQPKNESSSKQVENKNNTNPSVPIVPPSTNVVVAPSIEAPITDDFSVVPEKNKNKKKVTPQAESNKQSAAAALAAKNKKTGVTRNQFHLLELDEDDIVTDDTHSHNYEVQNQQQTKKSKKSSSTKSKDTAKKSKESSSSSSSTTTTSSSTKLQVPRALAKKEEKVAEPVKEQPKSVTEQPKSKKQSSQPQQNKKSEGVFFELINSIITPGVPTVVYKIIYFALIGVLLFSLVPLYYSGLNSMYMVGVVGLVLGLAITLTLFIQEFSRIKELKESKGSKKATSRKLK